jgi:hypothetical protein
MQAPTLLTAFSYEEHKLVLVEDAYASSALI